MSLRVTAQPLLARRIQLPWTLSAQRAALVVRGDERPFALIGRWAGGGALIGSCPIRIASDDGDPFTTLDEQPEVQARERDLVGGGWFGYLGYRSGAHRDAAPPGPPGRRASVDRGLPGAVDAPAIADCGLAFYDHVLRLDDRERWWFEALWSDERESALRDRLAVLTRRAQQVPSRPRPVRTDPWVADPTPTGHGVAVAAARERIHAGDLLQANIALRLRSRLQGDPLDLFAVATQRLPADRSAYLAGPWGAIVSLSPELFLTRHDRMVRSAPIKGTRPAAADPQRAAAAAAALAGSSKDRAENTMIVDLVRNDLGRVCETGSVTVDALAEVRRHAGVWHLVSEVSGRLRSGVGDGELLAATFPPGSVTGAPKVAAMQVIAELESSPRDVFTGAIGFASPLAGLELSVAIRTFEVRDGQVWLGVGGGVVADSDPHSETAECAVKAAPLLAAIGGHMAVDDAPPVTAPPVLRMGPRPTLRADPGAGVFETVLVRDGEALALEDHLARLASSVRELYGAELAANARDGVRRLAAGHAVARLRVVHVPGAPLSFSCEPISAPRPPVRLRTATVAGGIGAHKWVDRRLLGALLAAVTPEQPLLCDLDGFVLEAERASVFAIAADGSLHTPPLDGRILPGVTRARLITLAHRLGLAVYEEPLTVSDLRSGRGVFVTAALGGVELVHALDGSSLPEDPLAARLIDAFGAGPRLASSTGARFQREGDAAAIDREPSGGVERS